ncbi:MAG: hypothetical protein M3R60_05450, partial [Pseudomonadota bacterium]|nr:hypothetical protein [Pseudomonadota bacterium]
QEAWSSSAASAQGIGRRIGIGSARQGSLAHALVDLFRSNINVTIIPLSWTVRVFDWVLEL